MYIKRLIKDIHILGKQQNVYKKWAMESTWPEINEDELLIIKRIKQNIKSFDGLEIPYQDINVLLNKNIPPYIIYLLINNAYLHANINLINKYIEFDEKYMVMGAGIGVIAAHLAKRTTKKVVAIDANPDLEHLVSYNAEINNVVIDFIHGIIKDYRYNEMDIFYISEEFWSSSLFSTTYKCCNQIEAPIINWMSIIEQQNISCLYIDIESSEQYIMHDFKYLKDINKIFIEIHTPSIGYEKEACIMNELFKAGFTYTDRSGLLQYWTKNQPF